MQTDLFDIGGQFPATFPSIAVETIKIEKEDEVLPTIPDKSNESKTHTLPMFSKS